MKTVKLEEIVRQKEPELKRVVEQLARGEVGNAVQGLKQQGRIHEVKDQAARITAIASEYVRSPESTLVVSPDNRSRAQINHAIHAGMQERALVAREEYAMRTLVPRQELTGADRGWAARYEVGDVLRYSRGSKETGIRKGEYTRVAAIDVAGNRLRVVRANGEEVSYDPRRQVGVSIYKEEERRFSVGDRIQFTAPAADLKVANREMASIEGIASDGSMLLKIDGGRVVEIDPRSHPHIDHGYAVTSHSSQGQTAERVLIHVDTELAARDLLNSRMAYVAVSRGAHDAQIFTNDLEGLPKALGHEVSHAQAHVPEQAVTHPAEEITENIVHDMGFGIG